MTISCDSYTRDTPERFFKFGAQLQHLFSRLFNSVFLNKIFSCVKSKIRNENKSKQRLFGSVARDGTNTHTHRFEEKLFLCHWKVTETEMFSQETSFPIPKSCSAILQNLSVSHQSDKGVLHVSVIRKNVISICNFSLDDDTLAASRVLECGEKLSESEFVYQAKWLSIGGKSYFAVCFERGFQVFSFGIQ